MKFAMSYSCGKDSTLALHKMIMQGHEPACLVIMVNQEAGRSYFHGADDAMLRRYGKALDIPIITCKTYGEGYRQAFIQGLKKAKEMGACAACFGDIDIVQNREWEEGCCTECGLKPYFPLWQRGRREVVSEIIKLGYRCLIKSVNHTVLPLDILGRFLDEAVLAVIEASGADACGENGEYHTLAVDGPVFREPLDFKAGGKLVLGDYAVAEIF